MYAAIFKDSEASRKAWLKRQRAAAKPDSGEGTHPGMSMADYYRKFDDPRATVNKILKQFSKEDSGEVAFMTVKASSRPSSKQRYTDEHGNYTAERKALHDRIIAEILTPEAIKAATPKDGESPTFIVLGGRGGSGKSGFSYTEKEGKEVPPKVQEFDSRKFIVLDSDAIKAKLKPPYAGWNAFSVHEESSDIFDAITFHVANAGLNFIHDATLKSKGVKDTIEYLHSLPRPRYKVEGHYMFLPRQEAAKRAVQRYLGEGKDSRGRLVPPKVVLGNMHNEENFDALKPLFDKWSAYDNQGTGPVLINRGSKK